MDNRLLLIFIILSTMIPIKLFGMEFGYGVKAGISISNFSESGQIKDLLLPNKTSLKGLTIGPFFSVKTMERLVVQLEAIYTRKGAKGWEYGIGNGGDILNDKLHQEYNIDYLEFPILAKLLLVKEKNVKPYLIAGPVISIKLKEHYKQKYQSTSANNSSDNFETTDYGLMAGGGLELNDFLVEVRINYGLGRANKTVNEDWLKLKNRSISIGGGYHF